jgi:ABC-type nitrate/sulfonate/bicarbonate transport system substrate-binding protein
MKLIQKIDCITFIAEIKGKKIVVWEWENDLVLAIHLKENALDKDKKPLK